MNFSYIWKLAVTELNDFSRLETAMEEQVRQAPLARSRDQIFDDLPEIIFVGVFFAGYFSPVELSSEEHAYEYDFWEVIKTLIPTSRERRLAYLLFHCGLKPREIVQFCNSEFPDVREIHRLRRNIVERLLRQADTIRWRLSDEC